MDPMTMMTIVGGIAQFCQARQQAKIDEARYQQNRINAAQARDLKIQGLNKRAIQESEAAAGQRLDLAIRALETEGAQVVAAGEAGVSGNSVDLQKKMTTARRLRGTDVINSNVNQILDAIDDQKVGYNTEALNRINSMPRGQEPSFLKAVVSTAASAYSTELSVAGRESGSFLASIGLEGKNPISSYDPSAIGQPFTMFSQE
jgi:hypothetical protein